MNPCPSCPEFWNFGFDDSGVKDFSAEIDYILDVRKDHENLKFIGKYSKKRIFDTTGHTKIYWSLLNEPWKYNKITLIEKDWLLSKMPQTKIFIPISQKFLFKKYVVLFK